MDDVVFGITSEAALFTEYKISEEAVVMFKSVSCQFLKCAYNSKIVTCVCCWV